MNYFKCKVCGVYPCDDGSPQDSICLACIEVLFLERLFLKRKNAFRS